MIRPRTSRSRGISVKRQRIYRRRRIVVGITLLVVLAFVMFCVYSLARGLGAIYDVVNHDDIAAISRRAVPSFTQRHTSSVPDCTADDVKLELASANQTTSVGGSMQFTMTIRYEGSSSCLVDASNDSRILTITSGNDTVWRSNVCTVDPVMLLMSRGDKRVDTLTWNANRSGDQCVDDSALPKVEAGAYSAQLSLRGTKAVSEKVPFLVR